MKRPYGTGHIYEKSGAYYGRWHTPDGRRRNRRLGPKRPPGSSEGLTRAMAERALRKAQEAELAAVPQADDARGRTIDDAANALRERLELEGARKSYRQNRESMQRVHISPTKGSRRVAEVTTADVEALARSLLRGGLAPKSVRNIITFLHSVFGLAVDRAWCTTNPVAQSARPRRRRSGDASADLQFLRVDELAAVIHAIPDDVVRRAPAPTRRGRPGPAPPPPPEDRAREEFAPIDPHRPDAWRRLAAAVTRSEAQSMAIDVGADRQLARRLDLERRIAARQARLGRDDDFGLER